MKGEGHCRGWVACEDIDATTVAMEPLIVIPFGLRLSSEDAAHALQQRCGKAWDPSLTEVMQLPQASIFAGTSARELVRHHWHSLMAGLRRLLAKSSHAQRCQHSVYPGYMHSTAQHSSGLCLMSVQAISLTCTIPFWLIASRLRPGYLRGRRPAQGHTLGNSAGA